MLSVYKNYRSKAWICSSLRMFNLAKSIVVSNRTRQTDKFDFEWWQSVVVVWWKRPGCCHILLTIASHSGKPRDEKKKEGRSIYQKKKKSARQTCMTLRLLLRNMRKEEKWRFASASKILARATRPFPSWRGRSFGQAESLVSCRTFYFPSILLFPVSQRRVLLHLCLCFCDGCSFLRNGPDSRASDANPNQRYVIEAESTSGRWTSPRQSTEWSWSTAKGFDVNWMVDWILCKDRDGLRAAGVTTTATTTTGGVAILSVVITNRGTTDTDPPNARPARDNFDDRNARRPPPRDRDNFAFRSDGGWRPMRRNDSGPRQRRENMKFIQRGVVLLYPNPPDVPPPPLSEKPEGCTTVFVGGIPPRCLERHISRCVFRLRTHQVGANQPGQRFRSRRVRRRRGGRSCSGYVRLEDQGGSNSACGGHRSDARRLCEEQQEEAVESRRCSRGEAITLVRLYWIYWKVSPLSIFFHLFFTKWNSQRQSLPIYFGRRDDQWCSDNL